MTKGKTLAELAQKLKLPAAKLEATVARFNEHARRGKDLDFYRRPETIGPVGRQLIYGVQLTGADEDLLKATTAIVVNTHAQVMHHETKRPIPGLYACGATTAGDRIWGVGYQAGFQLAACITFALLAAEHAATANV